MINKVHPEYSDAQASLTLVNTCFSGEATVKAAGVSFLPMTSGQTARGDTGIIAYNTYKNRSIYHNYPKETAKSMLGMMWREPPVIEVPDALKAYETQITPDGLNMEDLLREINKSQLKAGRIGLLIDTKQDAPSSVPPYVVTYAASEILNWNSEFVNGEEVLTFVVLDESGLMINSSSEWEVIERYRVLLLIDGVYVTYTAENEADVTMTPSETILTTPTQGGRKLDRIPFVFCNVESTQSSMEQPLLLGLCNMASALYRQEADYRQALFMQGQGTPYATGVAESEMQNVLLGSMGLLVSENPNAEFGFLELSGAGLTELREAVSGLKRDCLQLGVAFIEQGQVESGTALETRLSTKTASIKTVALTGARALERALNIIAEWTGVSSEEISVKPNLEFSEPAATATDFVSLMSAKTLGAPISMESIHAWSREHGFTDLDYEDEQEFIGNEVAPVIDPSPEA